MYLREGSPNRLGAVDWSHTISYESLRGVGKDAWTGGRSLNWDSTYVNRDDQNKSVGIKTDVGVGPSGVGYGITPKSIKIDRSLDGLSMKQSWKGLREEP